MKIGGVEVSKCEELIVLPRSGEGNDIPIRAQAVSIADDFNALCPPAVAPMLQTKNGARPDYSDATYKEAESRRDDLRFSYLVLRSLEPSQIEWDAIDMEKPNTWLGWSDELVAAGLSEGEVKRVVNAVMAACSLDEKKIEEARKAFLLGQEA